MFKVGDWVRYNCDAGRHGYITEVINETLYKVYIPALKRQVIYKEKNIVPYEYPFSDEEQQAIKEVMIDLALATNDKKWFKEVMK